MQEKFIYKIKIQEPAIAFRLLRVATVKIFQNHVS